MKNIINLLIVDDDDDFTEALASVLAKESYTIKAVDSVPNALQALQEYDVDAILSDFNLPEATGVDFLKAIRKEGLATPFIMISGNLTQETVHKVLQLGGFEVFEKPAPLNRLYEVVSKAVNCGIQQRSMQDRLRRHLSAQDYELVSNNIKVCSKIRATL